MPSTTRTQTKLMPLALAACALALPYTACDGGGGRGTSLPDGEIRGVQLDRMGRAGVNTALIGTFNPDEASRGAIKDSYNLERDPADWGPLFASEISRNLGVYDALDANCGNQLLAGDPPAAAGRYDMLGSVLADDRLYVNTASGTCAVYLAVEANATGLIPNDDCGGRTPLEDTIDVTYSALAIGAVSGVTDGVAADRDSTHSTTEFPFLAPPGAS